MFGLLDISTSGLVAQRTRMESIAANIANKSSLYDAQGNYAPYRRRVPILAAGDPATGSKEGVHIAKIDFDQSAFNRKYEPGHPNADRDGYVMYPNVSPEIEMINALEASRAYEANIMAAEATKNMMQTSLRLLA
ncbi:MAG: flagellar basal body rod protein FlgC [Phycisphaeraceae bacterium]|nr:flagellar basal body rod protein FlgC [Phycisphaeraceae bacterium]